MKSGYDIEDLDDAIFGEALKQQLAGRRCQEAGCGGELRWTVPQPSIQMGQTVTLTGTCRKCGQRYELELRL